jgi:hypothetical protein
LNMLQPAASQSDSTWSRGRQFRALGLSSLFLLSHGPALASTIPTNWANPASHPSAAAQSQYLSNLHTSHGQSGASLGHTLVPTAHHLLPLLTGPLANPALSPSSFLPGQGLNLDLTSAVANIVLGSNAFSPGTTSATVTVGGGKQTFSVGQKVTAAEFLAIQEVLGGGSQTLTLNQKGAANGGSVNLSQLESSSLEISEIVIPKHVIALDYASAGQTFSFTGDLINYGSIYGISTDSSINSATISAGDIINKTGGLISTVLPVALAAKNEGALANLNLNLVAASDIVNAGQIKSAGDINLNSGTGNFTNSGLIASSKGNVTFDAALAQNINITGSGGTVQAAAGNINVREAGYSGAANINVNGGDYISQNLNLNAGSGAITGSVGNISGNLNSTAGSSHLIADSKVLKLGDNTISGDPLYVNTGGDIEITGVVDASNTGEPLTIIASGNVLALPGDTQAQLVNHGGDITVMAGASVSYGGSTQTSTLPGATQANANVTIDLTQASASGGNIDLSQSTQSTVIDAGSASAKGGNVSLIAYGHGASNGSITVPGTTSIDTHSATGQGGNVTVVASLASGSAVSLNAIDAGGTTASGAVSVTNATPTGNTGTSIIYTTTGAVDTTSAATAIVATNQTQSADVAVGSINAGSINIQAPGGTINLGSNSYQVSADAKGNGGSITVNGNNINWANSGTNALNLTASAGSTGNGGTVNIQSGQPITLGQTAGEFNAVAMSGSNGGNGGTLAVSTPGTLTFDAFFTSNYWVNSIYGIGTGNNYYIKAQNLVSASGSDIALISTPGGNSGNGGVVSVTLTGTNQVNIGTNPGSLVLNSQGSSGGGNGGTVILDAAGKVVFDSNSPAFLFSASATTSTASGNGGSLILKAHGIDWASSASTSLNLGVSAQGNGNGGLLSITDTLGSQTVTIGYGAGQIELFANAVPFVGSGNAGTITVAAAGNLIIDPLALGLQGPAGTSNTQGTLNFTANKISQLITQPGSVLTAGTINFSDGTSGLGSLATPYQVSTSNLSVNTTGSAYINNTGAVTLNTSSAVGAFNLSTTPDATNNGSITIGHLAIVTAGMINLSSSEAAGGTGGIKQIDGVYNNITSSAPNVSLFAGQISLQDQLFTGSLSPGGSGAILVGTNSPTGNSKITVNTAGDITIYDATPNGTTTFSGFANATATSNIDLATINNMTLSTAPGNFASLKLVTSPLNDATISLPTSNLTASSNPTTGKGGSILLQSSHFSWTAAKSNPLSLSADGSGTGNGGSISVVFVNSQGLATSSATIGTAPGAYNLSATGGAVSGSGGSVTMQNSGTITIQTATSGTGPVTPLGINVAPSATGSGNGGSISLSSKSLNWSAQGTNALRLAVDGSPTGSGGSLTINAGSQPSPVSIGTGGTDWDLSAAGGATSGNGGSINLTVGTKVYVDNGSGLNVSPASKTGNGGSITINASDLINITGAALVLNASPQTGGKGDGGNIALTLSSSTLSLGNFTSGIEMSASGGSGGGNGGTVSLIANTANILFGQSAFAVNPLSSNGNGGSISISAASYSLDPATTQLNLAANGTGTGNGGAVALTLTMPGQITLGNVAGGINLSALGANGGSVSFTDHAADVTLATTVNKAAMAVPNGLNITPTSKTGNGGSITLNVNSLSYQNAGTAALLLSADGVGGGQGGAVSLTLAGTSPLVLGTGASNISISASGTNGGSISLQSAGLILLPTTVNGSAATPIGLNIAATGTNGNGGSLALSGSSIAWTNSTTTYLDLNVNGQGTGNGGKISLSESAAAPITIGLKAGDFKLSAASGLTGGNGGKVSITDSNADIYLDPAALSMAPRGSSGNGGSLSITANSLISALANAVSIDASGAGKGDGGNITITSAGSTPVTIGTTTGAFSLSANSGASGGNGGSISIIASAADLNINTSGLSVAALQSSGTGGSISLTSDSLNFIGNGSLTANQANLSWTSGSVTVNTDVNILNLNSAQAATIVNSGPVQLSSPTGISTIGSINLATTPDAQGNGYITVAGTLQSGGTASLTSSESGQGKGGINQIGGTGLIGLSPSGQVYLADHSIVNNTSTAGNGTIAVSLAGNVSNLSVNTGGNAVLYVYEGSAPTLLSSSANTLTLSSAQAINVGGDIVGTNGLYINSPNLTIINGSLSGSTVALRGFSTGADMSAGTYTLNNLGTITGQLVSVSSAAGSNILVNNLSTISGTVVGVNIVSTPDSANIGGNLTISGGGTISGPNSTDGAINLVAALSNDGLAANSVSFALGQTFNGVTNIIASGLNQSVVVPFTANVIGNDAVNVTTPFLLVNGVLTGNPLTYTGGTGGATIANNTGNMDLSTILGGTLKFTGQNLVLLSTGDITDNGAAVTIDTSNATGSGGNVTLMAGFNFTAPAFSNNTPDSSTMFTIPVANFNTGNVSLTNPSTAINTSGSVNGGAVNVYAHGGNVTLETINSQGGSGSGGAVKAIGEYVTVLNTVTTTSAANSAKSGSVSLTADEIGTTGPVYVQAGSVGGGSIVAAGVGAGNVALDANINAGTSSLTVRAAAPTGSIDSSVGGTSFTAGTLSLTAGGDIGKFQLIHSSASTLSNISAGGAFNFAGTAPVLTLTGTQSAGDYNVGDTGAILIGNNTTITGTNSVTLFAMGNNASAFIDMVTKTGAISAPTVSLQTSPGGGSIGATNAIALTSTVNTLNLDAGNSSSVNVVGQSAALTLASNSQVANFSLTMVNGGSITDTKGISSTGDTRLITSGAGNITFNGPNASGVNIDLEAPGGTITLSPAFGSGLAATAKANGDGGSITIKAATLAVNNAGTPTKLTADGTTGNGGTITVATTVSGPDIGAANQQVTLSAQGLVGGTISYTASGNALAVDGGAVQVTGTTSNGTISLSAQSISRLFAGPLQGSSVTLTATAGDLGSSGTPLITVTSNLNANASGDAYILNQGTLTLTGASSAGGIFNLSTQIGTDGAIIIAKGASITAGTVQLQSNETTAGAGGIKQLDGNQVTTIFAPTIALVDIGASGSNIVVTTSQGASPLSFNASTNGSIDITTTNLTTAAADTISGNAVTIHGLVGQNLTINNQGQISANSGALNAASTPDSADVGGNLYVSGGGSMNAPSGIITLTAQNSVDGASSNVIEFTGNQTFSSQLVLNATGNSQAVIVDNPVTVDASSQTVVVNSPNFINNGTVKAAQIIMNTPNLAGTYASSSSIDIGLLPLTFNGEQLTILSGGDITDSANATINLSSSTGNGGNLYLLAGFAFNPGNIVGGAPDSNTYNITATGTGNIALGGSTILTRSTAVGASGGSVYAYANGSIDIGTINTSSTSNTGTGGSVTMIGSGVTVGLINTTSHSSGAVNIASATIALNFNPGNTSITVTNGQVYGGSFQPGAYTGNINISGGGINAAKGSGTAGTITLNAAGGSITSAGAFASQGNVILTAGSGGVGTANQPITTDGANLTANAGGSVYLLDTNGSGFNIVGANSAYDFVLNGAGTVSGPINSLSLGGGATITAQHQILLNAIGGIDISAGKLTAPRLSLRTDRADGSFSGGNLTLSDGLLAAGVDGSGNGGVITIAVNNIQVNQAGAGFVANAAGTGSGNGGTIVVTTANGMTIGTGTGTIDAIATSGSAGGNGGSAQFITSGTITLNTDSFGNVNGAAGGIHIAPIGANGDGGSILLHAGSITWNTSNTTALALDASGVGAGSGGKIDIVLPGLTAATIGSAAGQYKLTATSGATTGSGGRISFTAGPLTVNSGALNFGPQGANGNGGILTLTTSALSSTSGPLVLQANGIGIGNGGTIIINLDATTAPVAIGSAANNLELSANAGNTSGLGGSISVSTGGNLTVDPNFLSVKASGFNGQGGELTLIAGSGSGPGVLLVTGSLAANGAGTGAGGIIQLEQNSSTVFAIDSAKALSGVQGTLAVNGGSSGNGTLNIINLGGGVTVNQALTNFSSLNISAPAGGTLTLATNIGNASSGSMILLAPGKLVSKTIQADTLAVFSGSQPLTLATNVHNLQVSASGAVTVTNTASPLAALNIAGLSGSTVTIKSNGDIVNSATTTATSGAISLTSTGGNISNSGTLAANGSKGAITLVAAAANAKITESGTISSSGAIAMTAAKGSIGYGGLGAVSIASSTKTVALTAANTIFVPGTISGATGVTIKSTALASGLAIQVGAVSSSTGNIVLTAVGGIETDGAVNASGAKGVITLTASGANAQIDAKAALTATTAVGLTAAKGAIVVESGSTLSSATTTVTLTAGNTINEFGTINAVTAATLKTTVTSASPNNVLAVNNVLANNGPVSIIGAGGLVSTIGGGIIEANSGSSKTKATVTIEDSNTSAGSIVVAAGSTILTHGPGGGNVNLSIGAPAKGVVGIVPTPGAATYDVNGSITTAAPPGGPFFFGTKGITVNTNGSAALTLKSINPANLANKGQVIFSTGKLAASAITVNGTLAQPTNITADPPALSAIALPGQVSNQSLQVLPAANTSSALEKSPAAGTTAVTSIGIAPAIASTNASAASSLPNANVFDSSRQTIAQPPQNRQPLWISDTEISSGAIPAILHGREAFGLTPQVSSIVEMEEIVPAAGQSTTMISGPQPIANGHTLNGGVCENVGSRKSLILKHGSVVFAPTEDTVVHTPQGTLNIAAHSLVLVIAYAQGVAIYDLDDKRQAAVRINCDGQNIVLSPGKSVFLTSEMTKRFEEINPTQMIAYSNLKSHTFGERRVFIADFSQMTAAYAVLPLKQLLGSNHPEAKKIGRSLLKTTAILSQMRATAPAYQQYVRPRLAAWH